MDEVLAVWTARLNSVGAIWFAIRHGSDFSPPTYHLFLHFLMMVFGDSYGLLRLPSTVSILIACLCMFVLLRRYTEIHTAAFGAVFALLGVLSAYGVQARPYALVTMCFAIVAVIWDDLDQKTATLGRLLIISILLVLAGSLHFYAILLVPCVALMELAWSAVNRRLRIGVWIALIGVGVSTLGWLPLIRNITKYNSTDISSVSYYARPTLGKLALTYSDLFILGKRQTLFFLITFALLGIVCAARITKWGPKLLSAEDRLSLRSTRTNLFIIAFAATTFPVFVFIFSALITKTYNLRYSLIASLGISIFVSFVLAQVPELRIVINPLLISACALIFIGWSTDGAYPPLAELNALSAIRSLLPDATKTYPIVVGEALQYLQLEEAGSGELKSRLVYVTAPQDSTSPDPTNENQVKRWGLLRRDLHIVGSKTFFTQHPRFYLVHTTSSEDTLTRWLTSKRLIDRLAGYVGGASLFEVESPR